MRVFAMYILYECKDLHLKLVFHIYSMKYIHIRSFSKYNQVTSLNLSIPPPNFFGEKSLKKQNQGALTCFPRKNNLCLHSSASNGSTSRFLRSSIFVSLLKLSIRTVFVPLIVRTCIHILLQNG